MAHQTHSTKSIKEKEVVRTWHKFDASGRVLGRMTGDIANILQGKDKVNYAPYLDMGDYVVVVNAKKVVVTGKKSEDKTYDFFSGYPGGLRQLTFKQLIERKPSEVIKRAVSGMLPKNKLRKSRLTRLYIYADEKNPYEDKFK